MGCIAHKLALLPESPFQANQHVIESVSQFLHFILWPID